MEQWSILGNTLNYIQYDRYPKNYHSLGITTVNRYKNQSDANKDRDMIEVDFAPTPKILKEEYLEYVKEFSLRNRPQDLMKIQI